MRSLVRCLSVCALAVLCAGVVLAEDKKETKKEEKKPVPFASVFSFPKQIKLTEDQQKKLDQLRTEYTSQLEVIQKKYTALMTPERQKAGQEAAKQAKADGKKETCPS